MQQLDRSPVRGLTSASGTCATEKEPNPTIRTSSPKLMLLNGSENSVNSDSTDMSACAATADTKSSSAKAPFFSIDD